MATVRRPAREGLALGLRVVQRYLADGMVERAPAMAYYGILSLFPMLLIAFSGLRLVAGSDAPSDLGRYARDEGASGTLAAALRTAAETAQAASLQTAGLAGLVGFATLLYGASRSFTAAGRALDVVCRRGSTRRSVARRAQDLGWTLVVLAMASVVLVLTILSGVILDRFVRLVGLDGSGAWAAARWATLAALGLLIVAVVRWSAPTGARPPFRLVTAGGALSVGALLVATRLFDFYVSSIASYNDTYGAFTAAIVLILWLWMAASAFLLGAELDAVLDGEAGRPTPPREAGTPPCGSTAGAGPLAHQPRRTP